MLASYLDTWAARVGDAEHGPEAQGPKGAPRRPKKVTDNVEIPMENWEGSAVNP